LLDAVNETLPGTNTPVFTTFMDPPEVTDFDKAVVDNSVTMDLLNKAHVPGLVKNPVIHGLLDVDLYRELFSFTECGGFYSGTAFLAWFRKNWKRNTSTRTLLGKTFRCPFAPMFPS